MLVDTLSQFSSHIDISELKLSSGTMVFEEEEGKVCMYIQIYYCKTQCVFLLRDLRSEQGVDNMFVSCYLWSVY